LPLLTMVILLTTFTHLRAAPTEPPTLINPSMECSQGYYPQLDSISQTLFIPNGWSWVDLDGHPVVNSTQLFFAGECTGDNLFERIDGDDSLVVRAQDIETPPTPGKPFDVAFYQQTRVTTGTTYSLSAWMLSLCGGSAVPNDCPPGYYMSKMLGIDPTGGVDPLAETVVWVENRNNFVDEADQRIGWANLFTAATAEAMTLTVFARIDSPFQWHGNHAFIDAFSLLRAPSAELVLSDTVPFTGTMVPPGALAIDSSFLEVRWQGEQSADVAAIPGGSYQLLFDVQVRALGAEAWSDLVDDHVGAGCRVFDAGGIDRAYQFRVRPRAEQLSAGVFPNHRYPGVWSEPVTVFFRAAPSFPVLPEAPHVLHLPLVQREGQRACSGG
jgi:hypothetical protein